MSKLELRAAVSTIYTDYWKNKTDGRGMQDAIMLLLEQEDYISRINELTRLDNTYDEVTPDNFHEYYTARVKELSPPTTPGESA